jgi:hypothetical protein
VSLLSLGANDKRLRGAGRDALEVLRRAHSLATEPDRLAPWAELAAYRLAHVLMRRARTVKELEDVEALFRKSARAKVLGPWPRLYHLSVLSRIRRREPGAVPAPRLADAFRRALTEVRDAPSRQEFHDDEGEVMTTELQQPLFNALELCAYFLEVDYEPLEGLGDEFAWVGSSTHLRGWRLLGTDPELVRVSCTRDVALAELDAVAERHPSAALFRLAPHEVYRAPGGDAASCDWVPCKPNSLELWALILENAGCPTERARRAFASGENFRKTLERARRDLAQLIGRRADSVILNDREGRLVLAPGVELFGVVDLDHARELRRRRSQAGHA